MLRLRSELPGGSIYTTAFLVRHDGTMITSDRAVRGARAIHVVDPSGGTLPCEVLRHDPELGVAILRAPSAGLLPIVQLGPATRLRKGDWVVGIGHDEHGQVSARAGCVSRVFTPRGAGQARHFVIDAATTEGGAVLDLQGRVVALVLRPRGARRAEALAIDVLLPVLALTPAFVPLNPESPSSTTEARPLKE